MRHENFDGILALRIDVDFAVGFERALPRMLDALAARGMHATFFVVAGRNAPALRRLLQPAYLRRLFRLGPSRVAQRLLLPGCRGGEMFPETEQARRTLRRIVDEGHEVAVHGHDHSWWADHVWSTAAPRLSLEIERAYAALARLTDTQGLAWGSPNWRSTPAVLRTLADRGVPYLADCWGSGPHRSVDATGEVIPVPHLPITLPSPEGLILSEGIDPATAAGRLAAAAAGDRFDLVCLHDYFEGLLHPDLFELILEACRNKGVRTVSLREAARRLGRTGRELPLHRLDRGPLAGFVGPVSRQGDEIQPGGQETGTRSTVAG